MESFATTKFTLSAFGLKNSSMLDFAMFRDHQPVLGDLGLFEVVELGKHEKMQMHDKCLRNIYPGDRFVAAFGPRYATGQFEGYIPKGVQEFYHILGMGGAIGWVESTHSRFVELGPTTVRFLGFAVDPQGQILNSRYLARRPRELHVDTLRQGTPRVILSIGSSMDSGKTTSAAFLARGLRAAGRRMAYIKLTGTIFSKDADFVQDTGAHLAIDFSHFGYPSTYLCDSSELIRLFGHLLLETQAVKPQDVIVEIADGILQRETKALLTDERFMRLVDHVMYSCGDSLGVLGGLRILNEWGIEPTGISGLFTASPLLIKEVEAEIDLPVWDLAKLANPAIAEQFSERRLAWKAGKTINTALLKIA